jgi:hypothetical protein
VAVVGHEDVVLDAHASDGVVLLQDSLVDELGMDLAAQEVALDVLAAEIATGKGVVSVDSIAALLAGLPLSENPSSVMS